MSRFDGGCRLERLQGFDRTFSAQECDVGRSIAPGKLRRHGFSIGKSQLNLLIIAERLVRGDDEAGAPDDAARGMAATRIDRHNALCSLLNERGRRFGYVG